MAYKEANPLYLSSKWERARKVSLRLNGYLCQESKQYGKNIQAEVVHHIYPLSEYPELAYVQWNLLPVTNAKHNTFHDRENDTIVGRGLYWQQKRKKEFDDFYSPLNKSKMTRPG